MRHLAANNVGVLGEDAVLFGRDHHTVGDAGVVVAVLLLASTASIMVPIKLT